MKNIFIAMTLLLLGFSAVVKAQTNTTPWPATGSVGIGTTSPTELLQVVGGHIDLNSDDRAYMINRQPVLWYNTNAENIFVGVGAGSGTVTGIENTFVGNIAGTANTTGMNNTFIGRAAGNDNTTGFRRCWCLASM